MALEEKDLKAIKKIVKEEVGGAETRLEKKIVGVETKLTAKIDSVKEEIITTLGREIVDQAEINRAMIGRFESKNSELDKRVTRIEHHLGLAATRSKN